MIRVRVRLRVRVRVRVSTSRTGPKIHRMRGHVDSKPFSPVVRCG